MTLGFNVTTDRCIGCKTCSVACAKEHLLEPNVLIRRVRQINTSDPIGHAFVSMSCNHCDVPVCVASCPAGAYTKQEDTGLVLKDISLCTGCKTCIEVCPFNAPTYDQINNVTQKCDGCVARLEAGMLPMCVISCPNANITQDDFESLLSSFPNSVSIKEVVDEVQPNLAISLDPGITVDIFVDIDGFSGTVDTGNGMFNRQ